MLIHHIEQMSAEKPKFIIKSLYFVIYIVNKSKINDTIKWSSHTLLSVTNKRKASRKVFGDECGFFWSNYRKKKQQP